MDSKSQGKKPSTDMKDLANNELVNYHKRFAMGANLDGKSLKSSGQANYSKDKKVK
jgi:hypothetical protein